MPQRPKRPCRKPGCPELTNTGYCTNHSDTKPAYDLHRGSAHSRGYDADWRRVRLLALQRDYGLCLHCQAAGRVTQAVDVDHKVPILQRADLRLEVDNLQSLCRSCHVAKTSAEHRR